MTDKKKPPEGASKATRDCYDACGKAYEKCMEKAGSDAEKWACDKNYERCIVACG